MKTNESLFCGAPGILWEEGKDNALRELALLTPSRRAPPSPFRCHVCQPKACPSWVIIRCTRGGEVCGPPCPGQILGPASGSAARRVQAGTLKHRESWLLLSPCQRGSCQVTAHPWASVWHAYECLLCAWYGHLHQCFPDLSGHQNHLGALEPSTLNVPILPSRYTEQTCHHWKHSGMMPGPLEWKNYPSLSPYPAISNLFLINW